jgi:hypothetical protein
MHEQDMQPGQETEDNGDASNGMDSGLTDSELAAHGLIKIEAFTRTNAASKGNAARAKRARQKAKELGVSQLNIMAPEIAHPTIKELAKKLQAGLPLVEVLQSLLAEQSKVPNKSVEVPRGIVARTVDYLKRCLAWIFGIR